jgi:hypothetical protein
MLDPTLDLTYVLSAFSMLMWVVAVAAAVLALTDEQPVILEDVIQEMLLKMISKNNVPPLSVKRLLSYFKDSRPRKKKKHIQFDRERAQWCVRDDLIGKIPCFPDKSFECRMKHGMVDNIINHLGKDDPFWGQPVRRARKPTICPYVKFLCAQKMLCYAVSSSTFLDYFQMGETTSRRCLLRLRRGIVCCNALSDIYLRKPTKSEGCNIVTLHQDVHNIPGMMGSLDITRVRLMNCFTAWKRQFQGREKFADIGLEEVVDHN